MKRLNLVFILFGLLALAGIVFAQQQSSSKPAQSQQNSATDNAGWWCPMAGAGWANHMNNDQMPGPGWMWGNGKSSPRGNYGMMGPGYGNGPMGPGYGYGPMGPGMMYGPGGHVGPQTQQAPPAQQQPQKPESKR